MIAFPPDASIMAMAIATFTTGYTIFNDDNALLPTNRDTKIPSTMVYNDINTIMMIDGAAKLSSDHGVMRRFNDLPILTSPLRFITLF
jgi:hypothetical protein